MALLSFSFCATEVLHRVNSIHMTYLIRFLDPEGEFQKATLVFLVVVVVGISSLKIPKAFLIRSGAQRKFAYIFMLTFPSDLPSQIF